MAGNAKINKEIISDLNMVAKFIDALYFGRQQYKERIALMGNTLDDTIEKLKKIFKAK